MVGEYTQVSIDEASDNPVTGHTDLSPVLCSEFKYVAVNEFNFESMMVVHILHTPVMVVTKAVLIQKNMILIPIPIFRGYILLIFKAVPILHSLADTPDIRYHEAVS